MDGRKARLSVDKAAEPPCRTAMRTRRWRGEGERRKAVRISPHGTSPSAGAGHTDGCGQSQGTAVRSVPPHEAAASRKERRAARREAARKLIFFGFKFSYENLILTIPQKGAGDANVASVVHPAGEPTGLTAAPAGHEDLE